ncbi:MAG: diaminopimelate epimerase [Planctomycetota bacterium]|nr:diaminopimelate epimerase [Planctomycetota bacterium]
MSDGRLPFVKLHGLGNDYVYIDADTGVTDLPRLARFVSNRNFGVGSDGLIVVGRMNPQSGSHVSMRMFNADGSESAMCGNGVRCVAKYAVERGVSDAHPLHISTGRGIVSVEWTKDQQGRVCKAKVDMGSPELRQSRIPACIVEGAKDGRVVAHSLTEQDWISLGCDGAWRKLAVLSSTISLVSMGNPHAVLFCESVDRVPLESIGGRIERAAWFPEKVNVHFVEPLAASPRTHFRMRTWERGSGITQACGSGACAVAVAAVLEGRAERSVTIDLPGGALAIEWRDDDHVIMTGPCTESFTGSLDLAAMDEWSRILEEPR